jgi:hypothetical protein
VCTENSNPDVMMVKPAEDRVRTNDSDLLDRTKNRREAALARLDRRLSPADQRTIVTATRTPQRVRWPDWWSEHP